MLAYLGRKSLWAWLERLGMLVTSRTIAVLLVRRRQFVVEARALLWLELLEVAVEELVVLSSVS